MELVLANPTSSIWMRRSGELRPLRGSDFIRGLAGWELCLIASFCQKDAKDTRREIEKAKRELQDLKERGLRDEE